MQDVEAVPVYIALLPASISWHCCPKTCEKVTGPAAELEVTGEESIALFGSFVLVMGQSPAAVRSLLSLTDPRRAGGDPHCASSRAQRMLLSLFSTENNSTHVCS